MKHTPFLCLSLLLAPSFALAEQEVYHQKSETVREADGDYQDSRSTESINKAGTKEDVEVQEKQSTSRSGVISKTRSSEVTVDPKGLANKSWSKHSGKSVENRDGRSSEETSSVSVDTQGTKRTIETDTTRAQAKDGFIASESRQKVTTDPKGLMNKSTSEVTKTIGRTPNGSTVVSEEKKVDNHVVDSQSK